MIAFNKPYYSAACKENIAHALNGQSLFRGRFYQACIDYFQKMFGFKHVIPTASCTTALELVARLINIQPGDEIIIPSYTYISTANAFAAYGAKIVLADSMPGNPNIDVHSIETLISHRTKAIVIVHYGGQSCDIAAIKQLIINKDIVLVEDAAHAVDCKLTGAFLGTFGDFATFSFHETKNVTCGQGGILVINNEEYLERAFILKENGTNRDDFLKGRADKYVWLDVGSTYNLPELSCSILYSNLLMTPEISAKRRKLWSYYYERFSTLDKIKLPQISIEEGNGHIFYFLTGSATERTNLIRFLSERNIASAYHYIGLHLTPYYQKNYEHVTLTNAEMFTDRLIRLPMYFELDETLQDQVVEEVFSFYG